VKGVKIEFEKYNEKKIEVVKVSVIELLRDVTRNGRKCRIVWVREIMKEEKEKKILKEFRKLLKEYNDVFLEKLSSGLSLDRRARSVKRNYY
jgi:hypothetical protein